MEISAAPIICHFLTSIFLDISCHDIILAV
jgi:hypothetical protein